MSTANKKAMPISFVGLKTGKLKKLERCGQLKDGSKTWS